MNFQDKQIVILKINFLNREKIYLYTFDIQSFPSDKGLECPN